MINGRLYGKIKKNIKKVLCLWPYKKNMYVKHYFLFWFRRSRVNMPILEMHKKFSWTTSSLEVCYNTLTVGNVLNCCTNYVTRSNSIVYESKILYQIGMSQTIGLILAHQKTKISVESVIGFIYVKVDQTMYRKNLYTELWLVKYQKNIIIYCKVSQKEFLFDYFLLKINFWQFLF